MLSLKDAILSIGIIIVEISFVGDLFTGEHSSTVHTNVADDCGGRKA